MFRGKKLWAVLVAAILLVSLSVTAFAAGEEGEAVTGNSATCTYCQGTGVLASGDPCSDCDGEGIVYSDSKLAFTFWALVPPLVAIALALITKEVYSSLFLGILLGCFFYSNGNPVIAFDTLVTTGLIAAVADNAGVFLFLIILCALVVLVNKAGGSAAFGRWAEKNIKSRVGAMLATFVLGILIFVDDYFNCLTVGSVMLPISDRNKISRSKLAYLIDATAAPVCMIAPISSWAAAVTGVVDGDNGIALFCRAIPWNYYSLLTFAFIIAICLLKFDYGPMKLHEMNARLNGDLYTSGDRVDDAVDAGDYNKNGRVIDLILPIAVLIVTCFVCLVYKGGYWDPASDYYGNFTMAFANTSSIDALSLGSILTLLFTIIYFICRKLVNFKSAMDALPLGFKNVVGAVLILVLANALKNVVNGGLGGKFFIGNLMLGAPASLMMILPALIFLVGCLLSFSTGTSWGTFGILIPIVCVIFTPGTTLFTIGISACLAGAVFGDHCSPISDTTIMASAGAMCNHLNHVSTQLPYAATVGAICFLNYIIAGFIQNVYICLATGLGLLALALFIIYLFTKNKNTAKA